MRKRANRTEHLARTRPLVAGARPETSKLATTTRPARRQSRRKPTSSSTQETVTLRRRQRHHHQTRPSRPPPPWTVATNPSNRLASSQVAVNSPAYKSAPSRATMRIANKWLHHCLKGTWVGGQTGWPLQRWAASCTEVHRWPEALGSSCLALRPTFALPLPPRRLGRPLRTSCK